MLTFDKYAYRNRMIHTHPLLKLAIYLLMLGISFSGILSIQFLLIVFVIPLTCYVAKVNWKTYAKWIAITFPFVFLSLVTILLSYTKQPNHFLYTVPLFDGYIGASYASLEFTLLLLVRVYCSLVGTYFFILTVPFRQILQLCHMCHIPHFLIEIMLLMYRFVVLFIHEFIVMRDTLDLKFGFGSFRKTYQSWGLLANQLFTRLMKANEHLVDMLSLRFDDET